MKIKNYSKVIKKGSKPMNVLFKVFIILYTIFLVTDILGEGLLLYTVVFLLCFLIYNLPRIIESYSRRNSCFTEKQFALIMSAFTPRQFEAFCYEYFKALGYEAQLLPEGPDGGKDVILDKKIYVECKRYNQAIVGREICQKLLGAIIADKMEEGIIFTNGEINDNAKEFVKKTDKLKLWDAKAIYKNSNVIGNWELSRIIDSVADIKEEANA